MNHMGRWKISAAWELIPMPLGTVPASQKFSSAPCGSYEKLVFLVCFFLFFLFSELQCFSQIARRVLDEYQTDPAVPAWRLESLVGQTPGAWSSWLAKRLAGRVRPRESNLPCHGPLLQVTFFKKKKN